MTTPRKSPGTGHYFGSIRHRLNTLYALSANDPRLREQLSDEVDWVDEQIELVRSGSAQTSGWQPIETAPKDGTSVLAIRREWWEPVNGNHRWVSGRVYETYFDDKTHRFESHGLKQPTHWQPLPAPPSNQGASK